MGVKTYQPGPGLHSLGRAGSRLVNPTETGLDLAAVIEKQNIGPGANQIIQVNDCETSGDWSESDDGTFDYAVAATGKRVGTNCLKLTSTAACDNTQYVETALINESAKPQLHLTGGKRQDDWRDTRYLGFWVHNESAGDFSVAGEMTVAIVTDGVVQDKVNVQAIVDNVHQWFEIDMDNDPDTAWDLDKVEKLRFYCNNSNTGEDLYIDTVKRYDISVNGAPFYGSFLPIKSGITLSEGEAGKWSIDGADSSAGAGVVDLGFAKLMNSDGSDLTGTDKRNTWAGFPGMCVGIVRANAATSAGDYGEYAGANGRVGDVTTSTTENGYVKFLEAAGAQYDDIFALFVAAGAAD